ncbi:hypothetical protein LTS18_007042 [Coniosporium uncinatum]|uniref:Uncharacterized protein n=1 Tax=Coniosporium uncinatum TaxID=93489 RepID=A0ACC3DPT6_9PEZI|nr:hypothetical protein LTS18_007042 [Coniosporium uncinatum]
MSSEPYAVKERTMSTSHIRGYARGIGNERTDKLQLAIRQYISSLDLSHQLGDFTSIMFPGFGVAKVLRALFPQPDLSRPRATHTLDLVLRRYMHGGLVPAETRRRRRRIEIGRRV